MVNIFSISIRFNDEANLTWPSASVCAPASRCPLHGCAGVHEHLETPNQDAYLSSSTFAVVRQKPHDMLKLYRL